MCIRDRYMGTILENNKILKDYTIQQKVAGLSQEYVVLSECRELVDYILTQNLIDKLNKNTEIYQAIELIDNPSSTNNMLSLRVEVVLVNKDSIETSPEYTKEVLRIADHIANFRMGRTLRAEIQEKRAKVLVTESKEKREELQEELLKKKADKQKEKEAKRANLSPEQQRRLEERDYKRNVKRQNKKMIKFAKK
eukprot:TRINITY_DN851_c0_g1_i3.p1 TRINITY_DN851_c0_g1~~TRINITY_DN851_c0_g1_i3.p1  ORF type:complete len:195 (-),score=46.84 TRINITY_DN851_c0_g1_i3:46-630(-)